MLSITRHIALDLDEVLCPFARPFHSFHSRRPRCLSKPMKHYNFARHYGMSDHQSKLEVASFYNSKECADITPLEFSQDAVSLLNEQYLLTIVTGRQYYARDVTYDFIDTYFHGMFKDVIFTNSFSLNGPEVSKSDVCKDIGAGLLIDDNLNTCIDVTNEELDAYLFGDYDWNRGSSKNAYIHIPRISNWENFIKHQKADIATLLNFTNI